MRHLVFFVNSLPFFFSHRLSLALHARQLGDRVSVIAPTHDLSKQLEDHHIHFYALPVSRDGVKFFFECKTFFLTYRLLKKLKPHVLHLITVKPMIYGGLSAYFLKIPAVLAVTGLGRLFYKKRLFSLLRFMLRPIYRLIAKNPESVFIFQNVDDQALMKNFCQLKDQQIFLIRGSGVDIHSIPYFYERKNEICIAMISRLIKSKGVLLFLKAAEILHQQFRFLLVGGIDEQSQDAIQKKDLDFYCHHEFVKWFGYLDDVRPVLKQSHIVCLPTLGGEGLPKVLLEAAASGCAIVASDVPGCREIVQHGYNGYLFEQGNVDALVHCIQRIGKNTDRQLLMGKNGRKMVEQFFSLDKVIDDTFLVYERLLSR